MLMMIAGGQAATEDEMKQRRCLHSFLQVTEVLGFWTLGVGSCAACWIVERSINIGLLCSSVVNRSKFGGRATRRASVGPRAWQRARTGSMKPFECFLTDTVRNGCPIMHDQPVKAESLFQPRQDQTHTRTPALETSAVSAACVGAAVR